MKPTEISSQSLLNRERVLNGILIQLNKITNLTQTLTNIAEQLKAIIQCEALAFRIKSEDSLDYQASVGFSKNLIKEGFCKDCFCIAPRETISENHPKGICFCRQNIEFNQGMPGLSMSDAGSVWTNHVADFIEEFKDSKSLCFSCKFCIMKKYTAMAVIPIIAEENKIGLIQLYSLDENAFSPELIVFLEEIAGYIGTATCSHLTHLKIKTEYERLANFSKFLPICINCKKIRDKKGVWNSVEAFLKTRLGVEFTHSICPDCSKIIYPDIFFDDE